MVETPLLHAARQLWRPWRDGAFRVLALSLFIASLAIATVVLLRAELNARFADRGAEMLGGDLVIDGSRAPDAAQLALLDGLTHSTRIKFQSVVVKDGEVLLVGIKAVDDGWPLVGRVSVSAGRFSNQIEERDHGPAAGSVWVADQVLDRLALEVGDNLTLGQLTLTIERMLVREPDQRGGFYSMSPRVLMHHADLAESGMVGPGSRLDHEYAVLSDQPAALRAKLAPLLRPDQRLDEVADVLARSMGPFSQLTVWVGLGVMMISVLCGAAIYLSTGLRVARRATQAALLRTFGASRRQVSRRLLGGELLATLPAALAGLLLALLVTALARQALGWDDRPLAADGWTVLLLLLAPLLLLAAFALPRLVALATVPALAILNQQADSRPRRQALELAAALAGPMLIATLLTGSLAELGLMLLLLAGLGVGLPLLFWPLLRWLDRHSGHWPVARRLAVRRLSRRPATTLPLLAALTLASAILALTGQSGSGLLLDWQQRLPERAPNHFVFNLFGADQPVLADWLARHQAEAQPLYPIVRGRLTSINGVPVREAVSKEDDRADRTLNRDLALTEDDQLPASNRLLEGVWHGEQAAPGEVSVESEIADSLGLTLGDELGFVGPSGEVTATITSLREVDWDSFAPNFYFMFSPATLAEQDITWLTSFWLPEGDGQRLAELVRALPHVTLFDVNALLERAQGLIRQASQAIALLASLLALSALLVLFAALLASAGQRRADQRLLRTLGAERQLLNRVNWLEFAALGGLSALAALLVVAAAVVPLGQLLFGGELPWSLWQGLPLLVGLAVAALGALLSRRL